MAAFGGHTHSKAIRRGDSEEDFELKDLSRSQNDTRQIKIGDDQGPEEWASDDEKYGGFPQNRRLSASTVQSFMLYTPDEERAVIKKFDRRLILLLALLYMLSFLDRSSRYRTILLSA